MHQCHQVPQHPKQKPGPCEGGREQEELVAPLHVQERCPEVTHVKSAPPTDVLNSHIAPSILGQNTSPLPQSPAPTGNPTEQGF